MRLAGVFRRAEQDKGAKFSRFTCAATGDTLFDNSPAQVGWHQSVPVQHP
jgi:hypothetical protein